MYLLKADKGKLPERAGRKVMGLKCVFLHTRVARLPAFLSGEFF